MGPRLRGWDRNLPLLSLALGSRFRHIRGALQFLLADQEAGEEWQSPSDGRHDGKTNQPLVGVRRAFCGRHQPGNTVLGHYPLRALQHFLPGEGLYGILCPAK